MRVGILTSDRGGSPLQYNLEVVVGWPMWQPGMKCDLVLVFNQTWHTREYRYPETWPDCPVAFVDTAEYGCSYRPRNTFSPEALDHDTKNRAEQERLRRFLEGRSFPYFLREMWSDYAYSAAYHPIDYPLHRGSECERRPDRDEYLRRTVPVACIWGHSNPDRVPISAAMRAIPGADVHVAEEDGPRVPQPDYFRRLEAARCGISADGYGSGSFRETETLVRTALVRVPQRIRTHAPLVHGETCIDYSEAAVPVDPELGWRVYSQGYDHCQTHYTPHAVARRILDVCAAHDWNTPTPL